MEFSRTDCARARASVSAELDGELPELELEWQRAHLRICAACASWAEQVHETTRSLREAALLEPGLDWALPQRRRAWRVSPALAVASAAAVAAGVVVGLGPRNTSLSAPRPTPLAPTVASHPMGGAKLFTGHPVGLQNLLGGAPMTVVTRPAASSSGRVPA